MRETSLVIMAAGIGSRFGGGIKQLEPVGPGGEIIMDYSIHDALEAGFNRIIFIIRKDLEKDFREIIGNRIEKIAPVSYAFQELSDLPEGYRLPEGRTKPWGTGQAVLCAKELVREPFLVINADDFYGKEAYVEAYQYLKEKKEASGKEPICMVGFVLNNTLSENGGVTRGVCEVDENGHLTNIVETHNIIRKGDKAEAEDGAKELELDVPVSMNMWGLQPEFLDILEKGFHEFLETTKADDLKAEYLLPTIIGGLLKEGRAEVTVLNSKDKWFGVTYKEDKESVVNAIKELIEKGIY